MSIEEAAEYHAQQIAVFASTDADQVTAQTMNYVEEAAGVAMAAAAHGMPSVISFTVETDGRLPTGRTLREAIEAVDAVAPPAYYMINCAHPSHFASALEPSAAWAGRLRGLRANASKLSHAELDAATELDEGELLALDRGLHPLAAGLGAIGGDEQGCDEDEDQRERRNDAHGT